MRNVSPPDWRMPQFDFGWVKKALIIFIVLWGLLSCYTTVPADSVGVLTRLGKYQDTLNPGLRFRLPFGMDMITLVPVQRQLKLEFGFGTDNANNPHQFSDEQEEEASMVTGDLNMANVEWV